MNHPKVERFGERDRLGESSFGRTQAVAPHPIRMQDESRLDARRVCLTLRLQSAESGPGSYSCTGWAGMMVEIACLYTSWD